MLRGGFKAIHGDLLHIRFREKIVIFRRMRKRKKGKMKRDGRFFHLYLARYMFMHSIAHRKHRSTQRNTDLFFSMQAQRSLNLVCVNLCPSVSSVCYRKHQRECTNTSCAQYKTLNEKRRASEAERGGCLRSGEQPPRTFRTAIVHCQLPIVNPLRGRTCRLRSSQCPG